MLDPAGTNAYTYWPGGSVHTDDGPFDNDTVSYTNNYARLPQSLTLQQVRKVMDGKKLEPTVSPNRSLVGEASCRIPNAGAPAPL